MFELSLSGKWLSIHRRGSCAENCRELPGKAAYFAYSAYSIELMIIELEVTGYFIVAMNWLN